MRAKRTSISNRLLLYGAAAGILAVCCGHALAQSPLGVGTGEPSSGYIGPFAGTLMWINNHQQSFYRSLTGALKALREGPGGIWILVGISFAYGVFHAAGPGHGKAVISSYMVANEVELRRGILLAFISSMAQALTALLLMATVFLLLRGTSVTMTDATTFLQNASFALVMVFGAWLLWRKIRGLMRRRHPAVTHSLSSAAAEVPVANGHHDHHHHDDGEVCATCGHAHMPEPKALSGHRLNWGTAWSAVAAVGLRPCSGALIVLSFSLLNGLWLGGIVSVFAMALGTAITVSALAVLAVTAKNVAVRVAGPGQRSLWVHDAIEIGGALLVFLLGLALLTASLSS